VKRHKKKLVPVVLFAIALGVTALSFMTTDEQYVMAPAVACTVLMIWLWMVMWDRDQKIPFFDVGIFCALATLVYTVYPLLNYWADGMQFGFLSDSRLLYLNISPAELGFFHLRHVLYLFSFVVAYAFFRGKGTMGVGNVIIPSRSSWYTIVIFFLLLTGFFVLMYQETGVNYNSSYEPEIFAKRVTSYENLPLLLLQISSKLWGILFIFKLALLFIVVNRCKQRKWFLILLVWVGFEIILTVYIKGPRTGLILFLMAIALIYHRTIKPLSIKFLFTSGVMLFLVFIFLGIYRAYFDIAYLREDLAYSDISFFSYGNEFQSLLGTAYDVFRKKEAGVYFPWYLYLNDFIAIFPPQQLMPFEKVRASEWYLQEIGLSGTGQGYMWGVISQSIIGFDWIELALRGTILGYILARYHRWYLKHQSGFLETLLYVFFCLKIYYTFRDTTFSFLANIVWEVIPFYILLRIGSALLSRVTADKNLAMSSRV